VTEGICNFIIVRLDINGEAIPSQYCTWIKNDEELMRGVNIIKLVSKLCNFRYNIKACSFRRLNVLFVGIESG